MTKGWLVEISSQNNVYNYVIEIVKSQNSDIEKQNNV